MTQHYTCFDISNLLYRAFFAEKNEDEATTTGLAMHMAFMTVNKYFKKFKPSKVVMAFDRGNWRKQYTLSDECYSKKVYKGERRKDMSPAQKEKYAAFIAHIGEFETIMREHTTVICLAADQLEGDDCIAAWIQQNPDDMHTIISGDKDFVQLLRYENVTLCDPATGKERTCDDAEYYLFEKCFRGEPASTDNVQSAYPKLRATKIKAAYTDPFELTNLRQATWTNHDGRIMEVGKLLDENKLLMDLAAQPDHVKKIMFETVEAGRQQKNKFSYFQFMKFLGKFELKKLAEQADQFAPLLSR